MLCSMVALQLEQQKMVATLSRRTIQKPFICFRKRALIRNILAVAIRSHKCIWIELIFGMQYPSPLISPKRSWMQTRYSHSDLWWIIIVEAKYISQISRLIFKISSNSGVHWCIALFRRQRLVKGNISQKNIRKGKCPVFSRMVLENFAELFVWRPVVNLLRLLKAWIMHLLTVLNRR